MQRDQRRKINVAAENPEAVVVQERPPNQPHLPANGNVLGEAPLTPLHFSAGDIKVSVNSEAQPKRRRKGRKSMKRRSGQNGTVVIQAGWYRVRWRQDVEGQEQRQQMSEKIRPVVLDKRGNSKPLSPEVQRMAREIVERSGANSKEHFDRVVLGAETFKEHAEAWLREVQHRRYDKYKTSTVPTIEGALRKHIYPVIGHLPLAQVNNKSCKPLVEANVQRRVEHLLGEQLYAAGPPTCPFR